MLQQIKAQQFVEFIKFALVGSMGVLVNMGMLYLLTRELSVKLELASPMAIELSILSNFLLNNVWTFRKRNAHFPFWSRLLRYHMVTGVAGLVNYLVLLALVHFAGLHEMLANLAGIAAGMLINYFLNSRWTWQERSG